MLTNIQAAMLQDGQRVWQEVCVWRGTFGHMEYIPLRVKHTKTWKRKGDVRLTLYQQLWSRGYFNVPVEGALNLFLENPREGK